MNIVLDFRWRKISLERKSSHLVWLSLNLNENFAICCNLVLELKSLFIVIEGDFLNNLRAKYLSSVSEIVTNNLEVAVLVLLSHFDQLVQQQVRSNHFSRE